MTASTTAWPFGSGGECGPQFAATRARILGDTARLGARAAHEHWEATGQQGAATRQVLTDADYDAMERALAAGEAA